MRRFLLYVLILIISAACSPNKTKFGESLAQLDSVDVTALSEELKAEYTLLYMEAEVENYGTIIVVTDQEATDAGEVFIKNEDDEKIARMWAVVAKAQSNKGEYKAAAASYATAIEILESRSQSVSEKLKSVRLRFLIAILFFFVSTIIVINYYRLKKLDAQRRIEKEREERDHYMAVAEELEEKLKSKAGIVSDGVLERLCEQYYVYEGTDNLQPKIVREVKQIVEGLRKDSSKIENMLNTAEDNLMKRFREQNTGLKEDDIKLYSFLAAGLSTTSISALLEKDKQYIYNRIYRLKGRLTSSESPDKENFLRYIQK